MKKSIGTGRGSVYTIILKALQSGDKYGYEICKEIEEKSNGVYILKQPSLYSGLKRLEAQKDVCSYWGDSEIGGRRHYYSLTEKGKERINNTNFSWEDSRDGVIDNLFEKSQEEKTVNSMKQDIANINNQVEEIQEINKKIDEQLEKNAISLSDNASNNSNIDTIELQTSNNANTNKIERHSISPFQQDLFGLMSASTTENVEENNNLQNNEMVEENVTLAYTNIDENLQEVDVKEENPLLAEENSNSNENLFNVQDSTLFAENNKEVQESLFEQKVEQPIQQVSQDENLQENSENNEQIINVEQNENIIHENEDIVEFIENNELNNSDKTEEINNAEEKVATENEKLDAVENSINNVNINSNYSVVKAEKSVISVDDYLNAKSTKTLFDEEIVKTSNYQKPKQYNQENLEQPYVDEQDKLYEQFINSFEDNKNENLQTNDVVVSSPNQDDIKINNNAESNVINENLVNVTNTENGSSSLFYEETNNFVFDENFEFVGSNIATQNNEITQNNSADFTQTENKVGTENKINNASESSNVNFPLNNNQQTNNVSLESSNAQQFNNVNNADFEKKGFTQQNSQNNPYSDNLHNFNNETKENLDLKNIFGDLIEDIPNIDDIEIERPTLVKNEDYDYQATSSENVKMFKDYNSTNFNAKDDLPRIDLSNNINLTLKHEKKELEQQKSKSSAFRSFHDDEEEEKVETYNKMQPKENEYSNMNTFATASQFQTAETVPFDVKKSSSQIETEDYVVRRYSNVDISKKESKYLNVSKYIKICFSLTFVAMLLTCLLVNILAVKFNIVSSLQHTVLTCEYVLIGAYLIMFVVYSLLNKNKRKLQKSNLKLTITNFILLLIFEIAIVAVHLFVLKIDYNNFVKYYATLIVPTILFVLFEIINFVLHKIKNSSFLYK